MNALSDGVELLERATSYTLGCLHDVAATDLDRRTPCPEWNLRSLLVHVADSLDVLVSLVTTRRLDVAAPSVAMPAITTVDPIGAVRERAPRLLGAWSSATRRDAMCEIDDLWLLASTAANAGAIEVVAHGWDISRSCGDGRPIPVELATSLLDLAPNLITDATRQPEFGPAVTLPAGATPSDRFLAYLGRRPR